MQIVKWFLISMGVATMFFGCGNKGSNLRIACVGDSLTEGYKLDNPDTQSYPAQLGLLVKESADVKNFGIHNVTVLKKSEDPYWNTHYYTDSLKYNPDIVVIMFGSNDIKYVNWGGKENFVADYIALIESYKKLNTHPTIYICLPLPSYTDKYGISDARIVNELIPKIQEIASKTNVGLIDLHTLLSNKETLFIDKIHPTVEGTKIMAEYIYQRIY